MEKTNRPANLDEKIRDILFEPKLLQTNNPFDLYRKIDEITKLLYNAEAAYFSAINNIEKCKFDLDKKISELYRSKQIHGKNEQERRSEIFPETEDIQNKILHWQIHEGSLKHKVYMLRRMHGDLSKLLEKINLVDGMESVRLHMKEDNEGLRHRTKLT